MGLAARRRIQAIHDERGPRLQAEVDAAMGFSLPLELDLDSIPEVEPIAECYANHFDTAGPGLVSQVLRRLGEDEVRREALRGKVARVVFQNSATQAEIPGQKSVTMEGATLFVRASFHGPDGRLFAADELRLAIETLL